MSTPSVTQGPLRMVNPQLEGLLNAAFDGVLIVDHKGRIRLMSHAAERMFGYREVDLLGLNVQRLLPQLTSHAPPTTLHDADLGNIEGVRTLQARRSNDSMFTAELATGRIPGIEPPRFIVFVRDITDRVTRELVLQQSEIALHTAQQLANIGNYIVYYHSEQSNYASPQMRRIYDCDKSDDVEVVLARMKAAVYPVDRERVTQAFAELVDAGHSIDIEYRLQAVDGSVRHVHHLAQMDRDVIGRAKRLMGTVHDITDRKLADFELRHMQSRIAHFGRVSTMGEMATGLAHEINQPLAAIASYAQACRRLITQGEFERDEVVVTLEQIAQQALRAGEVIRRLRAFAKYHEATLVKVEANRILEELVQLSQTDAQYHNVSLLLQPAPEAPLVFADEVQIQQVLLNLVRNAIDAMQDTPAPQRQICLHTRINEKNEVEFMVADRGIGVPPDMATGLFNAFFTTKAKGTGLGLSISQSIVRAHGGRLWCANNPRGGARFMFSLPRV